MDPRVATFQQHSPRLYGIAYRMLGTRADAEDMLQEAYLRWHGTDASRVRTPEAWLTTTVTRLCIDRLRAARAQREVYVGPWLPEPLVGDEPVAPDRASELASDLSIAFLLVLERLAPEERAAFLLHEAFETGYAEIAGILGKSEAACRQIVHRARDRVRRERPRFHVSEEARRRLLDRFITAMHREDRQALLELFAPDATWTADGGGKTAAVTKALQGADRIAKLLAGFARRIRQQYQGRLRLRIVRINGELGILACEQGRPVMALSIETDGARILAAFNVVNPDKLSRVAPASLCGD